MLIAYRVTGVFSINAVRPRMTHTYHDMALFGANSAVNGTPGFGMPVAMAAVRALFLILTVSFAGVGQPWAQSGSPDTYFDICKRLGNLPGTVPMRRCIEEQREIDNDPLSALSETPPSDPQLRGMPILEEGLPGQLPGASSAEELLKSSPEQLLLGPDNRPTGQSIYE